MKPKKYLIENQKKKKLHNFQLIEFIYLYLFPLVVVSRYSVCIN